MRPEPIKLKSTKGVLTLPADTVLVLDPAEGKELRTLKDEKDSREPAGDPEEAAYPE